MGRVDCDPESISFETNVIFLLTRCSRRLAGAYGRYGAVIPGSPGCALRWRIQIDRDGRHCVMQRSERQFDREAVHAASKLFNAPQIAVPFHNMDYRTRTRPPRCRSPTARAPLTAADANPTLPPTRFGTGAPWPASSSATRARISRQLPPSPPR